MGNCQFILNIQNPGYFACLILLQSLLKEEKLKDRVAAECGYRPPLSTARIAPFTRYPIL